MLRELKYVTILVVLSLFLVPMASAADLSADYLQGRWAIHDNVCNSSSSEFITFDNDGTFRGTRNGKTEIVGFWKLDGDIIELDMLSSLSSFQDLNSSLVRYKGIHSYSAGQMLIFNAKKKSFEAFGVVGEEVKRTVAARCP